MTCGRFPYVSTAQIKIKILVSIVTIILHLNLQLMAVSQLCFKAGRLVGSQARRLKGSQAQRLKGSTLLFDLALMFKWHKIL